MRELVAKASPDASVSPESRGRLSDFRLSGRVGPLLAFAAALAVFWLAGSLLKVIALAKLWVAYAVPFSMLAVLAKLRGKDPHWGYVLPVAVLGVALGGLADAAVVLLLDARGRVDSSRFAVEAAIGAGFAAFFIGLSFVTAEVRRREQRAADARRQLLEARLKNLTAQIEPHFLMNTLANLRYLIGKDAVAAARMLDHLADFLEGALERSRAPHSTLGDELQVVESYLSIMRIRLGERLRFEIDVPEELRAIELPPLLLQTLVENAVTHGIEPKGGGGVVRVAASRAGDRVVLRVTDDGVGLSAATPAGHGVGLRNTRERLATFYAGRAAFDLGPALPVGTAAVISLPSSPAEA